MLSGLPKMAIAVALACSIGLHWGILQSIAWMGMIVTYAQEAPLSEALSMTFDGEHPCALCKVVAAGKKAEKRSEVPAPVKKLECAYSPTTFVFSAPAFYWETTPLSCHLDFLRSAPPSPPPRFV